MPNIKSLSLTVQKLWPRLKFLPTTGQKLNHFRPPKFHSRGIKIWQNVQSIAVRLCSRKMIGNATVSQLMQPLYSLTIHCFPILYQTLPACLLQIHTYQIWKVQKREISLFVCCQGGRFCAKQFRDVCFVNQHIQISAEILNMMRYSLFLMAYISLYDA